MNLAKFRVGDQGVLTLGILAEKIQYVTFINTIIAQLKKMGRVLKRNIESGKSMFTCNYEEELLNVDEISLVAVIQEKEVKSANLSYVKYVVTTIALTAKKDTIVVTKSTVPVGTNNRLLQIIDYKKLYHIYIKVVSNPDFYKGVSTAARFYVGMVEKVIEASRAVFVLFKWDKSHLGSW